MDRTDYFSIVVLMVAVLLGFCVVAGAAQEMANLTALDRELGDDFGLAVAISGGSVLVGAPGEDTLDVDAGAAYVFRFNGNEWAQEAKLTASDGALGESFGSSVAISGNYAVVGATIGRTPGTQNTGAAYVFYYDGANWTQQAKLTASDPANGNSFGCSVTIDGDLIVVGSWGNDSAGADAGSAYVFERSGTTWSEQTKLIPAGLISYDYFGSSVAIDGSYLVVGAWGSDGVENFSGAAYVFYYNGSSWGQQSRLTAADGVTDQLYGQSVAISGSRVVIGAPGDDESSSDSGAAYAYARSGSTWTAMVPKLTASDAGIGDSLGNAVAIDGDYMLVAARGDHSVYLFTWDGGNWVEKTKLLDSAGDLNDAFGFSAALSSDYGVVGAYGDDEDRGSAYLYDSLSFQIGPVYRFWSPTFSNHFYTISQAEKEYVINQWSQDWMYEGISYYAFPQNTAVGLLPVYRFWSAEYESHFYTISEAEKDSVISTYSSNIWAFEGPVFYAYREGQQPAGTLPVYRFWSDGLSSHFYTANEVEKDSLIANSPANGWTYEGVAWCAYE